MDKSTHFTSKELNSIGQLVSSIVPVSVSTLRSYYDNVINQFGYPHMNTLPFEERLLSSQYQLTHLSIENRYENCWCERCHFPISSCHRSGLHYSQNRHHAYRMTESTKVTHTGVLYPASETVTTPSYVANARNSTNPLLCSVIDPVISSPSSSSTSSVEASQLDVEHPSGSITGGKRPRYTKAQLSHMQNVLRRTSKPNAVDIMELRKSTGLNDLQIRGWFSYTKRKLKRVTNSATSKVREGRTFDSNQRPQASCTDNNAKEVESSTHEPQPCPITANSYLLQPEKEIEDPNPNSYSQECPFTTFLDTKKRRDRMELISTVSLEKLMKVIGESEVRLSCLIMLYMKKSLDMWKTLLTETARLQEMAVGCNPFTVHQLNLMVAWKKSFIGETSETLSEEKQGRLLFFREEIIDIWLRVVTYGRLTGINLESAIDEFCYQDGIERVPAANCFLVPAILRYMETHFL